MTYWSFRSTVGLAGALALAMSFTSSIAGQGAAQGPAAATPRMADGHPDLSGYWGGGGGGDDDRDRSEGNDISAIFPSRRCAPNQVKCDEHSNQSYDGEFTARQDANRPLYKPEYWDRVQFLDVNTNRFDPVFICQPYGVPRLGPPARILQTAKDVVFLYASGGAATQPTDFRIIPTDGRGHDPVKSKDVSFYGDSIGRWEGDTLAVDSVGFNDSTWLARGGYFHSDRMHAVERFRREGNVLHYQVTIEDPDVLLKPWVMNERRLQLNTDPKATIAEGTPCRDYDSQNMVTKIRH